MGGEPQITQRWRRCRDAPLLPGLRAPVPHLLQGPFFLKIGHVNRRLNRNHGPRHGLGGRRGAITPSASSSCRFHQGNKRSGIRHNAPHSGEPGRPGPTAAAAAGRFMTCSKCHLFNSPRWLHHLWTQHGLDCWPSVAGETCRCSPPHTNTPRERASWSQEGGRGHPYLQSAMSSSIS